MDIYEFINSVKNHYIDWLQHMFPEAYPKVCDNASDIFASYLIKHFPNDDIKMVNGTFNGAYHYWIVVNNHILDFTIVQFMPNYNVTNVFINEENYKYYKLHEYQDPSFVKNIHIDNFDMYLNYLN